MKLSEFIEENGSGHYIEEQEVLDCCAVMGLVGFPEDWQEIECWGDCLSPRQVTPFVKHFVSLKIKEAIRDDVSIIIATLNTNQIKSAKVLVKLGFKGTGWAKRPNDPDERTKVNVFIKHLNGVDKKVGV